MNLIKTSLWSGISTIIKMAASIVTQKILAVFIGPEGIALLGNFNNVIGMVTPFANGATGNGVIKYLASHEDDQKKQRSIVSQALKINFICSAVVSLIVILFSKQFSILAIKNIHYQSIFIVLGLTILFYGLNSTIISLLNGYRHIKNLIITNIMGNILSVVLAIVITIRFGLFGALLNPMIAQVFMFGINLFFVLKLRLFKLSMLKEKFDLVLSISLLKFGLMSLTVAIFQPLSMLIIRNFIYTEFSGAEAGFVQSVWSISATYLSIITTTLVVYYLPTLSSIKDNWGLKKEIIRGYKFLLPLAIVSGILIYLCRDIIIEVLFTSDFMPMKPYFTMQIVGDTLRVASLLLAHLLIAKAMTKWFIISEIIFNIVWVLLSIVFMKIFGSIGATYAYALNYLLYLLFVIWLFRDVVTTRKEIKNIPDIID